MNYTEELKRIETQLEKLKKEAASIDGQRTQLTAQKEALKEELKKLGIEDGEDIESRLIDMEMAIQEGIETMQKLITEAENGQTQGQ